MRSGSTDLLTEGSAYLYKKKPKEEINPETKPSLMPFQMQVIKNMNSIDKNIEAGKKKLLEIEL